MGSDADPRNRPIDLASPIPQKVSRSVTAFREIPEEYRIENIDPPPPPPETHALVKVEAGIAVYTPPAYDWKKHPFPELDMSEEEAGEALRREDARAAEVTEQITARRSKQGDSQLAISPLSKPSEQLRILEFLQKDKPVAPEGPQDGILEWMQGDPLAMRVRRETGASLIECKRALRHTKGDVDQAIQLLTDQKNSKTDL